MKKLQAGSFAFLIAALLFQACSLVPLTGRRQLSLVSDADMLSMSFGQYDQFKKENKMSSNSAETNDGQARRQEHPERGDDLFRPEQDVPGSQRVRVGIQPRRKQGSQRLVHAGRQGHGVFRHPSVRTERNRPGRRHGARDRSRRGEAQQRADEPGAGRPVGRTGARRGAQAEAPEDPADLDDPFRRRGPAGRGPAVQPSSGEPKPTGSG